MATQNITTANKPLAADVSAARKQFVQAIDTFRTKGKNLENAADAAARNTMAGVTNGSAMRDILIGISELADTDISDDTVYDRAWLATRVNYIQTLIKDYF
jgi:hypothetical protein